MAAEPLERIGTEIERAAFADLKAIFVQLESTGSTDNIDLTPFLAKLFSWSGKSFLTNMNGDDTDANSGEGAVASTNTRAGGEPDGASASMQALYNATLAEGVDVVGIWDVIVKLIMVVIPPLREVFLGHVANAQEVPGWLNLMSRCFRANFTAKQSKLEDVLGQCYSDVKENFNAIVNSATVTSQMSNAMVLSRAPEIFVVSVSSQHLQSGQDVLAATDGKDGKGGKNGKKTDAASASDTQQAPAEIVFPRLLDLNPFAGPRASASYSSVQLLKDLSRLDSRPPIAEKMPQAVNEDRFYELTSVVVLDSSHVEESFDRVVCYFRQTTPGDNTDTDGSTGDKQTWYRSCGSSADGTPNVEEVDSKTAIENSYYNATSNHKIHPRLLVYTRRNLPSLLKRLSPLVSRAGQMRALGDVAFQLAMTSENYGEARRCYEEAMVLDESLRPELQENLVSLNKFERTQRARKLEEQADLALANRRFKEAAEQYKNSKRSALVGSGIFVRVREKDERISRLLTLDAATALAERGEHYLHNGSLQQARELYAQAHKLTPEFLHLNTIMGAIDRTIQVQTATQKEGEASNAMKAQKYRLANSLYLEVISLAPEKSEDLQVVLQSLGPLMQGEDAITRQRTGLVALEEKRYGDAITCLTEAIELLPPNSSSSHSTFLADRAQVHIETKDFNAAVTDCGSALEIKRDLALGHFRLGTANFGLERFDDAITAYDKASRYDSGLGDQVKAKLRQVSSAREVQQRKQREEERAKAKEEQDRLLKEKREKEELARREKAEKAAKDKAERTRVKEEERLARMAKEKESKDAGASEKEAEMERKKLQREEAALQKAKDREIAKAAKEAAKERDRMEKEQRAQEFLEAQRAELKRKKDFEDDQERMLARQRDEKAAKDADREKATKERERVIAEREKARKEKLASQATEAARAKVAPKEETKKAAAKAEITPVKAAPVETPSRPTPTAAAVTILPPAPPVVNSWTSRLPIAAVTGGHAGGAAQVNPYSTTISQSHSKTQDADASPDKDFPPLGKEIPTAQQRSNSRDTDSVAANGLGGLDMSSSDWMPTMQHGMEHGDLMSGIGNGNGLHDNDMQNAFSSDLSATSRSFANPASELSASSRSFVYTGTPNAVNIPLQSLSASHQVPSLSLDSNHLDNLPMPTTSDTGVDDILASFGSGLGLGGFSGQDFLGSSTGFSDLDGLHSLGSGGDSAPQLGLDMGGLGGLGGDPDDSDPILRALGGLSLDSPTDRSMELGGGSFRNMGGLSSGLGGDGLGGTDNSGLGAGLGTRSHDDTGVFSVSGMLGMDSLGDHGGPSLDLRLSEPPTDHFRMQNPNQQQQMSPPRQHNSFQKQAGPGGGVGIDADIVRPEMCQSMFPAVAWLARYGMHMYHWAGDSKEWTEYALHLPRDAPHWISGPNGSTLADIQRMSRCQTWIDREVLQHKDEAFLVFHRGTPGQESNLCMNQALQLVSDVMRNNINMQR